MEKIIYIDIDQAIQTHKMTIEKSGGGVLGQKDIGLLDGVLCHIQNDDYYPSFEEKLTHLFWSVCKFHCFQDGNKRLALTLSTQFLLMNGYMFIASNFIRKFENISYHVASGAINKELLHEILEAELNGSYDYNEEIKLKIYKAISETNND